MKLRTTQLKEFSNSVLINVSEEVKFDRENRIMGASLYVYLTTY